MEGKEDIVVVVVMVVVIDMDTDKLIRVNGMPSGGSNSYQLQGICI